MSQNQQPGSITGEEGSQPVSVSIGGSPSGRPLPGNGSLGVGIGMVAAKDALATSMLVAPASITAVSCFLFMNSLPITMVLC